MVHVCLKKQLGVPIAFTDNYYHQWHPIDIF